MAVKFLLLQHRVLWDFIKRRSSISLKCVTWLVSLLYIKNIIFWRLDRTSHVIHLVKGKMISYSPILKSFLRRNHVIIRHYKWLHFYDLQTRLDLQMLLVSTFHKRIVICTTYKLNLKFFFFHGLRTMVHIKCHFTERTLLSNGKL